MTSSKVMNAEITLTMSKEYDYDDYCYECTGYGDDYYTDPETGEMVSACLECPYATWNRDDEDD